MCWMWSAVVTPKPPPPKPGYLIEPASGVDICLDIAIVVLFVVAIVVNLIILC